METSEQWWDRVEPDGADGKGPVLFFYIRGSYFEVRQERLKSFVVFGAAVRQLMDRSVRDSLKQCDLINS